MQRKECVEKRWVTLPHASPHASLCSGQTRQRRRVFVKNRRNGKGKSKGDDAVPPARPQLHVLFVEIFDNPLLCTDKNCRPIFRGVLRMQWLKRGDDAGTRADDAFTHDDDQYPSEKCVVLVPDEALVPLRPNEVLSRPSLTRFDEHRITYVYRIVEILLDPVSEWNEAVQRVHKGEEYGVLDDLLEEVFTREEKEEENHVLRAFHVVFATLFDVPCIVREHDKVARRFDNRLSIVERNSAPSVVHFDLTRSDAWSRSIRGSEDFRRLQRWTGFLHAIDEETEGVDVHCAYIPYDLSYVSTRFVQIVPCRYIDCDFSTGQYACFCLQKFYVALKGKEEKNDGEKEK